jgi:hypothetical protein
MRSLRPVGDATVSTIWSRICNGDPFYVDSWRDIAGYAQLVVNELEKS